MRPPIAVEYYLIQADGYQIHSFGGLFTTFSSKALLKTRGVVYIQRGRFKNSQSHSHDIANIRLIF